MLGFFSSSAISVLSDGFASFIHAGGRMRLIINDILTKSDQDVIREGLGNSLLPSFNLDDIAALKETLSERDRHFFECLAWLIRNERIQIKIITPKDGVGIAHTKCGSFCDGFSKVAFEGSVNFSRTALIDNRESLSVFLSWNGEADKAKLDSIEEDFELTFSGKDETVNYVDVEHVKTRISQSFGDKELIELLNDEYNLIETKRNNSLGILPPTVQLALSRAKEHVEKAIEKQNDTPSIIEEEADLNKPHFPFPTGPRPYQEKAYESWNKNDQKGLFAMATGTGKTITSLNVLYEIYKQKGYYKALILVPTIVLVGQWAKECKKFGFNNIIQVCSNNKNWNSEIQSLKLAEKTTKQSNEPFSYVVICTYSSFARDTVFFDLNDFPKYKLLFIADECHNLGAGKILHKIDGINYHRRIGLSATPERQFDEDGNQKIREFFNSEKEYTFEYSMDQAIHGENPVLCKYLYFPHVVRLTDEEMEEYLKISKSLAKVYNYSKDSFPKGDDIVKRLLLKRKNIIHKAKNKLVAFKEIIEERLATNGNLKYTLVYAPEGNVFDDGEANTYSVRDVLEDDSEMLHLIEEYTNIIKEADKNVNVMQFTSNSANREKMLSDFASGELDVLTSMKCLDEGVDVPRSEMAIFCASTGNPRQFIQRRGRILRTHKDKDRAIIHDLVVVPEVNTSEDSFKMEKRMLEVELQRVKDFALMSENPHITLNTLQKVMDYYNITIL